MAARKRASTRSKLLKQAVKAGRSALREAQRRMPPDVRRQIERTVEDGQKTMHTAIKQVQARLDRTARQADLDMAMKRLEALTRQVRNLASSAAASRTSRPARRKPASRKAPTRKPSARKPASKATPKRAAARRSPRATTRRSPAPPPATERSDMGEPG
jgi:polyhydroxyalkanoate synthesis regulator phasin